MSFSEWSNNKNKKKKQEQKSAPAKASSFSEWSNEKYGVANEDDIAPVTTTRAEAEDERGLDFFQLPQVIKNSAQRWDLFDDGYQFGEITNAVSGTLGDVAKTILGTVGDAGLNAAKGAGGIVEGAVDLIGYGLAAVTDATDTSGLKELTGKSYGDIMREAAMEDTIDKWTKGASDYLDNYSVLGRTSEAILEGVGYTGGIMATGGLGAYAGLGTAGVSALTAGVTGVSSMGGAMGEAYEGGATDEEALKHGLNSGAVDALSELLFGGVSKALNAVGISRGLLPIDDMAAKAVSKFISSPAGKNFAEFAVKSGFEGLEEVIAGFGSALSQKSTYMSEEEFGEILGDQNLFESFVVGTLSSALMQSGYIPGTSRGSLRESNQENRDFVTGYTQNEQAVIDRVVEDEIAAREANGEKLTKKDKAGIKEDAEDALKRGSISIDTIAEVLGGDDLKAYREALESEEALKKEYEELGGKKEATLAEQTRYKELHEQMQAAKDAKPKSEELRAQLIKNVFELSKKDGLVESFLENYRGTQKYEADYSKYEGAKYADAAKKVIDSAVKVADNRKSMHDTVDFAAKISGDTGLDIEFRSAKEMKETYLKRQNAKVAALEKIAELTQEQQKQLENLKKDIQMVESGRRTVNGWIQGNTILLNPEAKKALNRLIGHEVGHALLKAKSYDDMKNALYSYARAKGVDIDSELELRRIAYEGQEDADIEVELVNDMLGDYIFSDTEFVRHLHTENRNVFQRVWDEIKHLSKLATAGSEAARELEKAKHTFEQIYREGGKAQSDANTEEREFSDADTKYSIRDEAPPKKTIEGYKVFMVKDGKLYPPMVANPEGEGTPVGVWLNADVGGLAYDSEGNVQLNTKGRFKVKAGGKGTQGGSGELAFRPGWHLGEYPDASQFGRENKERLVPNKDGEMVHPKELFPYNFVWARCEVAADHDYQLDAMSFGVNENGKFERSQAGLPYVPEDGYYKYRTNANPDTAPWIISGAIKVVEILDDDQVAKICAEHGVTPQQRQDFKANKRSGYTGLAKPGNKIDLSMFGLQAGQVAPTAVEAIEQIRLTEVTAAERKAEAMEILKGLPGYAKRQINFDDANIINEFGMNNQSVDDYRRMAEESGHGYLNDDKIYSGETKYSLSDTDSQYMAAVESGDMETAQRMVDEAAKGAGYKAGVHHGTDADFTTFNRGELGIHVGTLGQAKARNDSRVMNLYANLGESFVIYRDYGDWHGKNTAAMMLETEEVEALARYDDSKYAEIERKLREIAAMPDNEHTDTVLREYLQSLGWDSITYENRFEDAGDWETDNWSYIVFDPEQVKSADPVTYDDNGNVIPLSERFNTENNDIRYSLSDSEGRQLSKGQQEYFKDSKVRDENGNLKVMYHGTPKAGFHEFDGMFSDDGISFFFVDSADVAESYSGSSEIYEARTFRTADDFNRFFAEIGASEYEVTEDNGKFTLFEDGDEIAESDTADGLYEEFKDWSGLGTGSANYAVYLNLKNPLVVDAGGADWNRLPAPGGSKTYEYIKILEVGTDGRVTIEYAMDGDAAPVTETVDLYAKFPDGTATMLSDMSPGETVWDVPESVATTREYAQYAKENGYDGVIFNDIYDIGGWGSNGATEATVAVAFDSSQIKSVANESPTADPDIRYSLSDSDGEIIEPERISSSESDVKYSLSHNDEIAQGQANYIANRKAYVTDDELKEAQRVTAAMVDVMMKYSNILPEDKIGKVLTKNGSYDRSVENTTICVRTLAYNEFVDKVQEEIGRPLTQMESFLVSQKLYDIATEPQCLYCYVSLDRKAFNDMLLRYMTDRDTVIAKYNNSDKSPAAIEALYEEFLHGRKSTKEMRNRFDAWLGYVDNGTQLLSLADIATEDRQSVIKAGGGNLAEQLKDARKYAQSASWSKIQKNYVAYRDEILRLGDRVVKNLNEHYGLRWYSFSDYSAAFIVENMQQITDASIRGLKGLAYTKDTDFAEIFAPTGMNINISVFVNTDADGNFYIDERQSAKFEQAKALRERYPNVGIVATVTNDEALRWAASQEWSDVIIPFHIVRTGTDVAEYYKWLNYTGESADTIADKDMWNAYVDSLNLRSESARKKVSKNIYPSEHKNDKNTYLTLCESRGLTPRFARFAGEDWYMKLVNETRLSADNSATLKPVFGEGAAKASFQKFVDKGGYEGGWYHDGVDVDAEARAVADDVLAGKKANEVSYGRQDGFVPEDLIASRKTNRKHGQFSLSDVGQRWLAPLRANEYRGEGLFTPDEDAVAPVREDMPKAPVNVAGAPDEDEPTNGAPVAETAATAEEIADKNAYTSKRATELYEEIRKLKKGVRASEQLGYLLDHGYKWSEVKKALLNIKYHPDTTVDQDSAIESIARKMLDDDFENGLFERETATAPQDGTVQNTRKDIADKLKGLKTELGNNLRMREQAKADFDSEIESLQAEYDSLRNKNTRRANDLLRRIERRRRMQNNVDVDYARRIERLEARIEKMSSPTYRTASQRRAKSQELSEWAENLAGDISTWRDKKWGLFYKTNTLKRNLRDIVRDENGNPDYARADAIYDELQGSYNRHEAELNRESNRIKQPYADMKITKAENAYIQMLGELRHNPDTTLTEAKVREYYEKNKDNIDKAKVDRAIEMARKTYDELLQRVNAVLREHGMKEIPYRQGYFPHFVEDKQGFLARLLNWKTQNNEIPTSIAGLTEMFNPDRSWQSFNKQRTGDVTDYNFTKGMDTYVQGALDWVYHIEDIQKRRAFENHIRYVHSEEGIKAKIEAIRANEEYDADEMQDEIDLVYAKARNPLNNFVTDLRAGTNTLANKKSSMDRGMEEMVNRKVYSTLTNINNRVSANMVAGSVSSALTNFIPITQSWGEVSPVSSLRAAGDTIRSTVHDDGMVDKSDFLTNRLRKADNLYKTGWDKVSDKVGMLMEGIDSFTSQVVWRSKYLENISNGMSEDSAIKNADEFAAGVMADRSRGNMPTIFDSKNPLIKTLTAFQLEVNNQYGYMLKDMPQDMRNESVGKLVKGYATMFMGAYFYNALYSSLTGRNAAFDPIRIIEELFRDLGWGEDDEEEEPVDAMLNLANNLLEEAPFIGGLLGGGRIPLSSALPYSGEYEGFSAFAKDFAEGDWEKIGKEMLNPVYYLALPMGGGQIRKTVQGLGMFSDEHPVAGSYTDSGALRFPVEDTFGNRLQAALFGQYASENARDYFDNERSPMGEKQIQEFIDVDMPIRDYWDYRDGLKELSKVEEKFDYIAGLDLTDEQKNILINNVVDRKEEVDISNYDEFATYEEFDFYSKNTDKYNFLQENGVSYADYTVSDEARDAYNAVWTWYNDSDNSGKVTVSKAVMDNPVEYRRMVSIINAIEGEKDANGETVRGTKKRNQAAYIFSLDLDYGQQAILYRSMFSSKDDKATYDADIIDYLNSRDDITVEEMVTILEELEIQ